MIVLNLLPETGLSLDSCEYGILPKFTQGSNRLRGSINRYKRKPIILVSTRAEEAAAHFGHVGMPSSRGGAAGTAGWMT